MTLETQRKNIMANLESQKLANEFLFCKFTREEAQQIVDEAIKLAYPEESDSSQA